MESLLTMQNYTPITTKNKDFLIRCIRISELSTLSSWRATIAMVENIGNRNPLCRNFYNEK